MNHKKIAVSVRKALIQQEMASQRKVLKQEIQPIIKIGDRLNHLFNPSNQQTPHTRKTMVLAGMALSLAVLGRRRGGWLGKAARYLILNYPGLLRRFM